MNSAVGARWLASSEVISQVLFTSEYRAVYETLKSIIFLLIVADIAVLVAIYWTCLVYTKTIIQIHIIYLNSGEYLPRHFSARQISTTIHWHLVQ